MITRRQALLDLTVVILAGAAYVISNAAGLSARWIIPSVIAALAIYAFVLRGRGETWRDFALRSDNLLEAGWRVGVWTLLAAGSMIGWAWSHGSSWWRPELAILLPLYPFWGMGQQLIFQGIFHRRLMVFFRGRSLPLLLTAAAFGLVHLGDWRLVVLTALAGGAWSWFFQRWPNVWVLGASHGILAALAYPLLLSENPLDRF